ALLAGCGSSSTSDSAAATDDTTSAAEETAEAEDTSEAETSVTLDGTWPEEGVTIGVEVYDTTDEQFLALQEYFDYVEENFNISFMYSESIENSEGELDFISSCASAGCDAIMGYYNVSGAEAMQQTIDQGMYCWGTEQYYDDFADEDLYVGTYTFVEDESSTENGDYLGGYQMAYSLAEQGVTHIFYCNGGVSFGIQMFIDRQSGFVAGIEAAQADGYEITFNEDEDIVEGWPGTDDFTSAVGKMLASDYDGVAVSFNAASLFQPIADAGKSDSISVATIGETNDTYYDAVNSGLVTCIVYDCEEVVFANAIVQIVNAATGYGDVTRTDDGKAGKILTQRWTVTDADTFNAIYEYHDAGNFFVTAEDLANMFAGLNGDITFDDIYDYYSSLDAEGTISAIQ
ncbi:MAG: hypothetical protein LUD53_03355, partial [Clostridiales bacterium]|nr:hypothetical protein [Clostridiales bacterium]